jgi:hypothetical protein
MLEGTSAQLASNASFCAVRPVASLFSPWLVSARLVAGSLIMVMVIKLIFSLAHTKDSDWDREGE